MAKRGRPLKYKTVAEMEAAIDAYFDKCRGEVLRDDDGKPYVDKHGSPLIINARPPTVTGLALALGFTSRRDLLNYQGKKEFCYTITRAKSMCEEYAEMRLFDRDGAKGAEFSLRCNFRWRDNEDNAPADLESDALSTSLEKLAAEIEEES